MRVNRDLVFWGVALVTAGAVALLIQAGTLDPGAARQAWRWWPAVLIAIGLAVIAARTPFALVATIVAALAVGGLGGTLVAGLPDGLSLGCGGEPTATTHGDGAFTADAVDVELELNCGELRVATANGDGWTLDARHGDGGEPDVESDGASLAVESEGGGFAPFGGTRQVWDVGLPSDVDLALDVQANAAATTLDLADMTLRRLSVDTNAGDLRVGLAGSDAEELELHANAGSLTVTVDDATRAAGSLSVNAGSIELCVPDGTGMAITVAEGNVTFNHNLDDSPLTRDGDTWRSASVADVELSVEGNAGSFTLNPDGGCQ